MTEREFLGTTPSGTKARVFEDEYGWYIELDGSVTLMLAEWRELAMFIMQHTGEAVA